MPVYRRHKKIFYVPGMISLVLIPLFCVQSLINNKSLVVYSSLYIEYVDTLKQPIWTIHDEKIFSLDDYLARRNFRLITLNGPERLDKIKIKNGASMIRKIAKENDSVTGVKFSFGNKTTYNSFVGVINMLADVKAKNYVADKDDIYFFNIPPRPHVYSIAPPAIYICGYAEVNAEYFAEREKQRELQFLINCFSDKWYLFLTYFGIVLLNVFAFIKHNRQRNTIKKSYI